MQRLHDIKVPNKRLHRRLPLKLEGRYRWPGCSPVPCETIDISLGGVLVQGQTMPREGQGILLQLPDFGPVSGTAVRIQRDRFAMAMTATVRQRDWLASVLTWHGNRSALGLAELRKAARLAPDHALGRLSRPDGWSCSARIIDLSATGVAVQLGHELPLGTPICIGDRTGRVVRTLPKGCAIAFDRPLTGPEFSLALKAGLVASGPGPTGLAP